MILRPRQEAAVEKCLSALNTHGNTLLKAPTGAGKTVMMSAVAGQYAGDQPILILQHRGELVDQNRATFKLLNHGVQTSTFDADSKRWSPKGATFAMVQTLTRATDWMPKDIGFVAIDECHHVPAPSYMKVIDKVLENNPDCHIFGVTATPERGDKEALSCVFSNVADNISMGELIAGGFLVPPKAFVIDLDGIGAELSALKKKGDEYDMDAAAAIMDKEAVSSAIITHWKEKAGDRQTVVFASTILHAEHLCEAFQAAGVASGVVHGKLTDNHNESALKAFDRGALQILVNCMKLTEGWDCQPVSCVLMARPCSQKSTMIQIVGRGLRTVDPSRYPGVIKDDCVVLDFGRSLLTHGDIEAGDRLEPIKQEGGEAPMKACPECHTEVYAAVMKCPECGFEFPPAEEEEKEKLVEFTMTEFKILELSPFKWEEMFEGLVLIANGLTAWACIVKMGDVFYALGRNDSVPVPSVTLVTRNKTLAVASADDYLRTHGDSKNGRKTRSWVSLCATDKQVEMLGGGLSPFSLSRYRASCMITWKFNEQKIKSILVKQRTR